jgi:tight adherence protein C
MSEVSFMQQMLLIGAIGGIGLAVFVFAWMAQRVTQEVEADERDYMDPLPVPLAMVWPLVLLLANSLVQFYTNHYLDRLDERLQKNGLGYILNAEQFVALRYVCAFIATLVAVVLVLAVPPKHFAGLMVLGAGVAGFMFPLVWMMDVRKRRERDVIRTLPAYLDFITLAVEAGLNLTGAMQQAIQKGPGGPLRNEFAIMMREVRSGLSRAEAMKRLANRLDMSDINSFVNAMLQAERMGSSMAKTLRVQSEQRRNERFLRAEKKAMEAPVKLIFPLVVFIFPVTFIVLGFPIMMKFLGN